MDEGAMLMKLGTTKGGERKGNGEAPEVLAIFSSRGIGETIRNSRGNAITNAIMETASKEGNRIEVVPVPEKRGFRLEGKGGAAYIEEDFVEDDDGLNRLGCKISMESMRLPWFRKSLATVLGHKDDDSLYKALMGNRFFNTPWASGYPISLASIRIFGEKVVGKLASARKAVTAHYANENAYLSYFKSRFRLPERFAIGGPYAPWLRPVSAEGLKSMVKKDAIYKKALTQAAKAAQKIMEEAKKPATIAKKIREGEA